MNCKLHINQRKSGTLCGSAECGACLPFRKPASPLMGVTPSAGSVQVAPGEWYDSRTGTTFAVRPQPTYVEAASAQTQLDREVAADRALYTERRVMLAGMAMQGLTEAWGQPDSHDFHGIASDSVQLADALLSTLFPTKFPPETV